MRLFKKCLNGKKWDSRYGHERCPRHPKAYLLLVTNDAGEDYYICSSKFNRQDRPTRDE